MTTERLKIMVKLYRSYVLIAVAAVLIGLLAYWLFRGYGGRHEVGEKLTEIKEVVKTGERRADEIIDATKTREEAARNEVSKDVAAVSANALPDVLSGLLSDYRKSR